MILWQAKHQIKDTTKAICVKLAKKDDGRITLEWCKKDTVTNTRT